MLASAAELGINRDHSGIIELDAAAGAPLPGCRPTASSRSTTSRITHRPDLWGHHGMAREVAAILGHTPERSGEARPARPRRRRPSRSQIEDLDLCPRYSALVFENVTVQPSPLWLQARLTAIGLNPINNIVDMTNYVMAELAQPMHAFDADLLQRRHHLHPSGRRGRALPRAERRRVHARSVEPGDCRCRRRHRARRRDRRRAQRHQRDDHARGAGERQFPGVISVRKTSSAIKLRTDASMRFEKAQDPANTVRGLARAIELLQRDFARHPPGGRRGRPEAEMRRRPPPIDLPLDWLERKLGRAIDAAEVRGILERLEFGVAEPKPGVCSASPCPPGAPPKTSPSRTTWWKKSAAWWATIPSRRRRPLVPAAVPPGNPARKFQHEVRNMFVDQGFTEVYNYSFLSEEAVRAFGFDPADARARDQPHRLRPGADAHLAAARHLAQRAGKRQASRNFPPVRNRPGDS